MNARRWIFENCKFASAKGEVLDLLKGFGPVSSIKALRKKISNGLWKLCSGKYYDTIPLKEIRQLLSGVGVEMENDFVLTGHDADANLELKMGNQPLPFMLHLHWYRMGSGRFEITAYLTL